jgi:exodeoxyribonuclease-5
MTSQQNKIINSLLTNLSYDNNAGRVSQQIVCGYAGTGKTTIIGELRNKIFKNNRSYSVSFLAYTGKAASVLKTKLVNARALHGIDYCGTIHGLIYKPKVSFNPQLNQYVITGWERRTRGEVACNLIIIDEGSMISGSIWNDLLEYDIPIIVFGDHGQLPPIDDSFNLLQNPQYMLTEIHRQALNSPIIKLSKFIRNNGYIKFGAYSPEVFKISWRHPKCKSIWNKVNHLDQDLAVLCAFNKTRAKLNDVIRDGFGFKEKAPYPTEKVVCLANNHQKGIMNGQIGNVVWVMPSQIKDAYRITIEIDGAYFDCDISKQCFGEVSYSLHDIRRKYMFNKNNRYKKTQPIPIEFFDYGYAISVHKSQGSEWKKVILFEQRTSKWDDEHYTRWLYTAVTRAKEKLFIITDYY